jgi:hypothetical protein
VGHGRGADSKELYQGAAAVQHRSNSGSLAALGVARRGLGQGREAPVLCPCAEKGAAEYMRGGYLTIAPLWQELHAVNWRAGSL